MTAHEGDRVPGSSPPSGVTSGSMVEVQAGYPEVFKSFPFERGTIDRDRIRTRVGSVQRRGYDAGIAADQQLQDKFLFDFYCAETVLTDNSGVFEWLDICETVLLARGGYTFVELGAGYARWAVIAYFAARLRGLPARLVCVEPEPTHYRWMLQNLQDNGIRPGDHILREGAATARDGYVDLDLGGDPSACYGQSVVGPVEPSLWERLLLQLGALRPRNASGRGETRGLKCVSAYSLATLLEPVPSVDLVHMDLQGSEHEVLASSVDTINEKVKRLHIGTHSSRIESDLVDLLGGHDWRNLRNHAGQGRRATAFGEMDFEDGVQTWVNPRFAG